MRLSRLGVMRMGMGVGLCCLLVLPLGCGETEGPRVEILDSWARPMTVPEAPSQAASGIHSAVYLTLRNSGGEPDTLLGGETPLAGRLEIHRSFMDGDVMKMRPVGVLALPPDSTITMAPGGLHVMLLDLRSSLSAGDTLPVVLNFRTAGEVTVQVPVRGLGAGAG